MKGDFTHIDPMYEWVVEHTIDRGIYISMEENWSRFLWGKCIEATFAACFQRTEASVFL